MADPGTYSDESEDSSIGDRLANSVKKIAKAVMPRANPVTIGGNNSNNADTIREAGTEDNSNIGRMKQAQSTDRDNGYSY